ncbi:GNAT family N-acetyltransferase [Rhodanobacter sp. MP7CTX1]|jgi:GNAT superfamily N-acetyltransferase|uniref:GNAT family N-acetyltransferase n=1 Tax=Rhodanobacter sp. MP7CTX1 TaxID=2723084 RepID=UPI0016219177|nr:GNAT family N-acetyltransferase [Rhodanobacter sp. MP7CTX1]MBB6188498.1 GNAT superfamily N-acetyltransferase [Rhodanobacter sp. MP7CTX1]
MGESLLLRPARQDDAAQIARLADELGYPSTTQDIAARLTTLLPQSHHHVVVAQGDDGLLGWIAVERRLTLESGERIEIVGLVVSPIARRGGIGQALVADAERWTLAQGFDSILVRSNVARAESHPFYESLGYVRRKTQHLYSKPLGQAG